MTEATWGEETHTQIDWRMSAALENVPRGNSDVAEVTSLEAAVRVWNELDPKHRTAAILTTEHPIQIDGRNSQSFEGDGISMLFEKLSSTHGR